MGARMGVTLTLPKAQASTALKLSKLQRQRTPQALSLWGSGPGVLSQPWSHRLSQRNSSRSQF